jgi:hypothetical protein
MSEKNIEKLIAEKINNKELPCAVAFEIVGKLAIPPAEIGAYADAHRIRLVKCQLGLFGYQPEKKIVKPADSVSPELEKAIRRELVHDRLPCKSAWALAKEFNIQKMAVSSACEALGIKIKPCQLGAF